MNWHLVYDVLILLGGDPLERHPFMEEMARADAATEWRFGGRLGFGGKYWRERNIVNFYPEDGNVERERLRTAANSILHALALSGCAGLEEDK